MRRTRIKQQSKKSRKRREETAPPREQYVRRFGFCWACLHRPRPLVYPPVNPKDIACHEILRGTAHRQKALDQWCQIIVACGECNCGPLHNRKLWPDSKQLALVMINAPDKYDLEEFNHLRNPDAPLYVEQHEVDHWVPLLNGPRL